MNGQIPVGLSAAKEDGFTRLEYSLKEIIPDADAIELINILRDYTNTDNETVMADGAVSNKMLTKAQLY